MSNVLVILTADDTITLADGPKHPTGFWVEELVTTHCALTADGHAVTIGSPHGDPATVDVLSLEVSMTGGQERSDELSDYLTDIAPALETPIPLEDLDAADFNAVLIPGGHGPMSDLVIDADTGRLLTDAHKRGALIGALCHGPAALLAAQDAGANIFAGYQVTAFTDTEETQGGLADNSPWLLASRLAEAGLALDTGASWSDHVVADRNLITGQNPQSSKAFAAAITDRL